MINLNNYTDYTNLGVSYRLGPRAGWFVCKYRAKFKPMAADLYLAIF